jgi:hypothetical protein
MKGAQDPQLIDAAGLINPGEDRLEILQEHF